MCLSFPGYIPHILILTSAGLFVAVYGEGNIEEPFAKVIELTGRDRQQTKRISGSSGDWGVDHENNNNNNLLHTQFIVSLRFSSKLYVPYNLGRTSSVRQTSIKWARRLEVYTEFENNRLIIVLYVFIITLLHVLLLMPENSLLFYLQLMQTAKCENSHVVSAFFY